MEKQQLVSDQNPRQLDKNIEANIPVTEVFQMLTCNTLSLAWLRTHKLRLQLYKLPMVR